jgi:hypothetical protein
MKTLGIVAVMALAIAAAAQHVADPHASVVDVAARKPLCNPTATRFC